MLFDNKTTNSTTINGQFFKIQNINEVLQIIVLIFVLLTNLLLIVGVVKTNARLSRMKRLIVYLSCIDMMYTPSAIATLVVEKKQDCWFIALITMIEVFIRTNGMLTFMVISLLRYHSIVNPLLPISQKVFAQIIAGKLSVSLIFSSITVLQIKCIYKAIDFPYFYFLNSFFIIIVNLITLASNIVSNRYLRTSERIGADARNKKKHSMKTLFIITVVYLIMYMPFLASNCTIEYFRLTQGENKSEAKLYLKLGGVASTIGFSNNAFNALIYALRNKKIGDYYARKASCLTSTRRRRADITTMQRR